jgi:ADP-ribose pyrophosphatase
LSPGTLNSKLIHRGRVFDLVKEQVALPNGMTADMEVIRHPGAAAVLGLTAENQILMLKQYRHAIGETIWEIPAGTLEPDESPLACAQRELVEESGFSASRWNPLGNIRPVPGYSDESISLFLARDLKPSRQHLDADEIIQVHRVPFDEVMDMIADGRIQDAKTISAVFLTLQSTNTTSIT